MRTTHRVYYESSRRMDALADESADLIITSPPYPMIRMWDEIFSQQDPQIGEALKTNHASVACELMHKILDEVWKECFRIIKPGGFVCVNIGDATRSFNGDFRLFSNHSRITEAMIKLGFSVLPNILWHKSTTAPNKFMGSGMLPAGAYVTMEHEYILIFRKGSIRHFNALERKKRSSSAYFWEERNTWYSDTWNIKGHSQKNAHEASRERNAGFPLEIPYRLIQMFSVQDDLVADPFAGYGTTCLAAMASGRNSIGYEIDPLTGKVFYRICYEADTPDHLNKLSTERLDRHRDFANTIASQSKKEFRYLNQHYNVPVMTRQERHLHLPLVNSISIEGNVVSVEY